MTDQATVRLTEEHFEKYPQLRDKGWNVDEVCPQSILDELEAAKAPAPEAAEGSAE